MKRKITSIVDQLIPYNPERIILFGSYAYGKPSTESDVDLVLIKKTNETFSERLKRVRMLLRTTTPVDVFVFTPKEFEKASKTNSLIEEISKTGKVIYG